MPSGTAARVHTHTDKETVTLLLDWSLLTGLVCDCCVKKCVPALTKQQISTCYIPSKQNTGQDHTGNNKSTKHAN